MIRLLAHWWRRLWILFGPPPAPPPFLAMKILALLLPLLVPSSAPYLGTVIAEVNPGERHSASALPFKIPIKLVKQIGASTNGMNPWAGADILTDTPPTSFIAILHTFGVGPRAHFENGGACTCMLLPTIPVVNGVGETPPVVLYGMNPGQVVVIEVTQAISSLGDSRYAGSRSWFSVTP